MQLLPANIKFLLCLAGLIIANASQAEVRVEVMAAEGMVMVGDELGKISSPVQSKSIFSAGKILSTGPNSRAVIRVGSDGVIVVGKNSQIEIGKSKDEAGFFRQIKGIVYYALNSIKGSQRPIEVKTSATTIGIRGTRFLVTEMDERNEIGMRKGLVNVSSADGEFEVHKKAAQDEFEAFKQEAEAAISKQQHEFAQYNAQTQQDFIEYKREFSLAADRMASFDGKRVVDSPLGGETKKDMESFENYAEEWLKSVND